MTLKVEKADGIAIVTLDNPPVNALGQALRQALLEQATALNADPSVNAVVLIGSGKLFVGGADITEFDRAPVEPHLPAVLNLIAHAPNPWVAALHGSILGGGLELALACSHRVATSDAIFGFPEVNLGLIPGAGGTQRLSRLIGVAAAIPVVTEKRMLSGIEAKTLGLVDELAEGALVTDALHLASLVADAPLPIPAEAREVDVDPALWDEATARLSRAAKGASAPLLALRAMRIGVEDGVGAGLAFERATFLALRESAESAALRRLFFAERAAQRPSSLRHVPPLGLRTVGIVGGGTMGRGIAVALLEAGYCVLLSERDDFALDRGREAIRGMITSDVKRGRISQAEAEERLTRLQGTIGLEALAPCQLVIEAVFEDLAIKQAVFAELSRICAPEAIFATNTSYLNPQLIARDLSGLSRFIGLHFFSPAHVMKLLEVIPVPETSETTLATAFELARRLKKIPVRAGICDGFIGNRILKRYRAEAEAMVEQGIAPAEVDAAIRGFGFAMGPFEMQDLAGLDISWRVREAQRVAGEAVKPHMGDLLVAAGRLGIKTGGGWYDYAEGDRRPKPSETAARLIAPMVSPGLSLTSAEIVERIVATMVAEGTAILAEGIAVSPEDIDLVLVHGYGFPRTKGGPMFIASRRGAAA